MIRRFSAGALALFSAAATPTAQPPLTPDGWGALRIGMTRAEVIAAVGDAADREAVGPGDQACDEFHPERAPEGLFVMLEEDRLTRLSLSEGATLRTDRGFGIGDREAAVRTAYGTDLRVTPHAYQGPEGHYLTAWARGRTASEDVEDPAARGIRYETDPTGIITLIHAGGPSIQYIEGCA